MNIKLATHIRVAITNVKIARSFNDTQSFGKVRERSLVGVFMHNISGSPKHSTGWGWNKFRQAYTAGQRARAHHLDKFLAGIYLVISHSFRLTALLVIPCFSEQNFCTLVHSKHACELRTIHVSDDAAQ